MSSKVSKKSQIIIKLLKAIDKNNLKLVREILRESNNNLIFANLDDNIESPIKIEDDAFGYRTCPFFLAAGDNHYTILKYFLKISTKLKSSLELDEALIYASGSGDLKSVKLLLKHGADPHFDDEMAIGRAAIYGKINIVKYLLRKYKTDSLVTQALDFASGYNHSKIVRVILNKYKNINTDMALNWAIEKRFDNIIKIFVQKRVKINDVTKNKLMKLVMSSNNKSLFKLFMKNYK